ncbi:MAG TPA: sugar phosphate isomerase/epimerase family protein [Planctomycetaceae bacterium]|jgi:sugar phosphate isomerase/epimerase
MIDRLPRRSFLKHSAGLAAGAALATLKGQSSAAETRAVPFQISLAEWSLHRALKGGQLDNLDFAKTAKQDYGIEAIEFVNQFFKDKAKNKEYLAELKKRADDLGVRMLLIMCDGEGNLGDANLRKRLQAVENHYQWVEAAKYLGCHSIRVNAASSGSYDEQLFRAADGLRALTEFADPYDINVIVENHGGLSSNGQWLTAAIRRVDHQRCGTLPDFGNFRVDGDNEYDRYVGVTELMPLAKAVSAKSHEFNGQGDETKTDYRKMMRIVLKAGYHSFVGIEYEGSKHTEPEGIMLTKKLLEKVRQEMT